MLLGNLHVEAKSDRLLAGIQAVLTLESLTLRQQALNSATVQSGLKDILLHHSHLRETLHGQPA